MIAEIILDKGNNNVWFYFKKDKIIVEEGRLNNREMTLREITGKEFTQVLDTYFKNGWNYKDLDEDVKK
jgi:hypothetical protein